MQRKRIYSTEKLEFTLTIIVGLLLIVSLLPKKFPNTLLHLTSAILLFFISIRIYHMVKRGSSIFEDYAALVIVIIFWAIHLTLGNKLHAATVLVFVGFLALYGVSSILWAKEVFQFKNIMLFILSYAVFVTLIIFLFAGAYFANNTLFHDGIDQKNEVTFGESIYFSTITFTTVGYGDIRPLKINRIIASTQAITAIVLNIAFMGYILASRRFRAPKEHPAIHAKK